MNIIYVYAPFPHDMGLSQCFFFFFFFAYEMFMHIQMQGYTNSEIH